MHGMMVDLTESIIAEVRESIRIDAKYGRHTIATDHIIHDEISANNVIVFF